MDEVIERLIRDLKALREARQELEDARDVYESTGKEDCSGPTACRDRIRAIRKSRTTVNQARRNREDAFEAIVRTAKLIASLWLLEKEAKEKEV